MHGALYRYSAFTTDPAGGNPAGVWIGGALPDPGTMQRIAAEVGFSETAFLAPEHGPRRTVRYYSPEAEVSFCGHATIAAGVQLGYDSGEGEYQLDWANGDVQVRVAPSGGVPRAALTTVAPQYRPAPPQLLAAVLFTLGWDPAELDPSIPAALAYAGAWHFVIAAGTRGRLDRLEYDFEALKQIMRAHDLTTIQLVWRESPDLFHARDPFPVGGVVEDPATGAAAAALGGYLRDAALIEAPAVLRIHQGDAMGRPSRLTVEIPATGGITVSGNAVRLDGGGAATSSRYPVTIENGAGERLTFARRVPGLHDERVEGSALVAPGAGPPMHVHYLQDEAFTVMEGLLGYQILGREPAFAGKGETILFRAGEPHRFWNAGTTDLHCTAYVEPPGNFEFFLAALFSSQRDNGGKRPSLFDVAYLTRRYRSEYRMLVIPVPVQRILFPILVGIGTLLGKYAKYTSAPEPLSVGK